MARINIEDSFWISILDVAVKSGNVDSAIGNAIRFIRMAQEKYKHGIYITEQEFKDAGFSDSLFPSIACRTSQGIQAVGADEHFGWLRSKVENGRKGGKSKSPAKTATLKQNRSETEATPKRDRSATEASPSPSPSYSLSSSSPNPSGAETTPARPFRVSDASRMESRFRNYSSPDREKYRDVLRGFIDRTDPRLKLFLTERFIDQAMAAFSNPSRFFDYLESLEQTWRSKKPDNAQAYFKTSWRENVLDRAGDVAIGPALAEGAR